MKRLIAVVLWTFSCWYLGSMLAFYLGGPSILGPALGIVAGTIVGADPARWIWHGTADHLLPDPQEI